MRDLDPALQDIAHDRDNNVLILTGTGDQFIGAIDYRPMQPDRTFPYPFTASSAATQSGIALRAAHTGHRRGERTGAGAFRACVLSDIVLASPNALFQGPFAFRLGPGARRRHQHDLADADRTQPRALLHVDGPRDLGQGGARARVVNEIVASERLMTRAVEIAKQMLKQPKLVRKHTRSS